MMDLLIRRRVSIKGEDPYPADAIMTVKTNPEVLAICYAQGWCANANYMTEAEAATVTNIGNVFQSNSSITHFNELKYFGISSIANQGFRQCSKLTSVILPANISLGNSAFAYCPIEYMEISIGSLSVGSSTTTSTNNTRTINYNATNIVNTNVFNCNKYTSDVYDVYDDALYNGSTLILFPTKKTSILFKSGVGVLGSYSLASNNLTSIVLPEGVTTISDNACYGANAKLTQIEFPSTVTSIGVSAFSNCSKVNKMIFRATTAPSLGKYCFSNVKTNGIIYIPTGATGYSGGYWDSYLFNRGWTLEYLT